MGLDITFNARSRLDPKACEEVGYFRKVNFILTYFDVNDSNCERIEISKSEFEAFVKDLFIEKTHHDARGNIEPWNQKLRTKDVFFGGSIEYDNDYWNDIDRVYEWASKMLKKFKWRSDEMFLWCSW